MIKKMLRSRITMAALLVLSAVLVLTGTIKGAQAALTIQSRDYLAHMQLTSIYTELLEAPTGTSDFESTEATGTLLSDLSAKAQLKADDPDAFHIGQTYDKKLAVRNAGSINEYVRVTVYRYWIDAKTEKRIDVDPSLIKIEFDTSNGWVEDTTPQTSTAERTVLYYQPVLTGDAMSTPFTKSLTIDGSLAKRFATDEFKGIDVTFKVEAVVDAVQTHHQAEAMTGVWGKAYDVASDSE